jgi:hypothetical protein
MAENTTKPATERRAARPLSELEQLVLLGIQELQASGQPPTAERIAGAIGEDLKAVRGALSSLRRRGIIERYDPGGGFDGIGSMLCPVCNGKPRPATAGASAAVPDRDAVDIDAAPEGLSQSERGKEFNTALLRLVDGKGAIYVNLKVLTGLSVDSLKSRVKRARWDYPEGEEPTVLDADEKRALSRYYRDSNDPAVREFCAGINATPRKRPDWRSSSDEAPKRGKARRPRRVPA